MGFVSSFRKFNDIDFFPRFKIEKSGNIDLSYTVNNRKASPKGGGYGKYANSVLNFHLDDFCSLIGKKDACPRTTNELTAV
jgi:hypothetical protein